MIDVAKTLLQLDITPDVEKDQLFLADEAVAEKMVIAAGITKSDRVLEVGPGLGVLTRALAERAKEVVTIEIDTRFRRALATLPSNVTVVYGDAYKLLNDRAFRDSTRPPTKTVSSIPYSRAQNMLHNYTNHPWYQGDLVWLAPSSLAEKVNTEPILSAYFHADIVEPVTKEAFYPEPNTSSAIIRFTRIAAPLNSDDLDIYVRRYLYNHEEWKVKNALREVIIAVADDLYDRKVTKKEAKRFIAGLEIPEKELERLTSNIRPEYYFEIPKKIGAWFSALE